MSIFLRLTRKLDLNAYSFFLPSTKIARSRKILRLIEGNRCEGKKLDIGLPEWSHPVHNTQSLSRELTISGKSRDGTNRRKIFRVLVERFRERLPSCDFYLEKCRWRTTAKVDARICTFVYTLAAHTCSALGTTAHTHTHARVHIHSYTCARSPYVGTRIEMEWDFSSIYSSCERIPTHIRCYLPFVPSRVKPLNGRLQRAIVWRASGINVKKGRLTGKSSNAHNGA